MARDLSPDEFVERMDRRSRTRALADHESAALENAIKSGLVSKREAARLGLKRNMGAYRPALTPRSSPS